MMKTATYRLVFIFLMSVALCMLLHTRAYAQAKQSGTDFSKMKELESQEKAPTAEKIARPKVDYTAENLRDPFQGVSVSKGAVAGPTGTVALPKLEIQGLVWGGKFPQAIINNKVVKAGDMIEGVRIVDISKDGSSITVFFEGKQVDLNAPAYNPQPNKPQGGKK